MKCRGMNKCIIRHGKSSLRMGSCRRSRWFFSRITGSISSSGKCITRRGSNLILKKCKGGSNQKFDKRCGAFVHIGISKGKKKPDKVFEAIGTRLRLSDYRGTRRQLWHYQEFVRHSKCRHKRYKVLKFRGSIRQTVMNKNMLGMPTKMVTVSMWIRGTRGTMFSYASKNHVNSFVVENPHRIIVHVMDQKIKTNVHAAGNIWTHIAVTWNSKNGQLHVFKNGKKAFSKKNVRKGKHISAGGCLMLGQRAKKACKTSIPRASYKGLLTDVMVWMYTGNEAEAH